VEPTLLLVLKTGEREDAVLLEPGTPIEFDWKDGATPSKRWSGYSVARVTPLGTKEPIELLAESIVTIQMGGGSAALDARRLGIDQPTE